MIIDRQHADYKILGLNPVQSISLFAVNEIEFK